MSKAQVYNCSTSVLFHNCVCKATSILHHYFSEFSFSLFHFDVLDAEKGQALAPFFSKFSSLKMVGKKGSVLIIDYKNIEKATDNFLESNILGEGGFGCVYKARLDDNLDVAVKKLHCESQIAQREFEVISANHSFCFCVFKFS